MDRLRINKNYKNIATGFFVAIFFIIDRLLKQLALNNFSNSSHQLLGDYFSFTFTGNYNIAFSLPLNGRGLNFILAIIILGLLIYTGKIIKTKQSPWQIIGCSLLLLGAVSNYLDRLVYGFVIDYLYLKHFTIFNLADVGIFAGVVISLISLNKKPG